MIILVEVIAGGASDSLRYIHLKVFTDSIIILSWMEFPQYSYKEDAIRAVNLDNKLVN